MTSLHVLFGFLTWSFQNKIMVSAQAILTQLVFDHALRIRIKAETPEQPSASTASTAVATPDSASEVDTRPDDETLHDNRDGTSQKSQKKGKRNADLSTTNNKIRMPTTAPQAHKSNKTENMVGKINNLVTSDLQNLVAGVDFLSLGKCRSTNGYSSIG